jgi:hypothetical protein
MALYAVKGFTCRNTQWRIPVHNFEIHNEGSQSIISIFKLIRFMDGLTAQVNISVPTELRFRRFEKNYNLLPKELCSLQQSLCTAAVYIYQQSLCTAAVYIYQQSLYVRTVTADSAPNLNTSKMKICRQCTVTALRSAECLQQLRSNSARPTWRQWFDIDLNSFHT